MHKELLGEPLNFCICLTLTFKSGCGLLAWDSKQNSIHLHCLILLSRMCIYIYIHIVLHLFHYIIFVVMNKIHQKIDAYTHIIHTGHLWIFTVTIFKFKTFFMPAGKTTTRVPLDPGFHLLGSIKTLFSSRDISCGMPRETQWQVQGLFIHPISQKITIDYPNFQMMQKLYKIHQPSSTYIIISIRNIIIDNSY